MVSMEGLQAGTCTRGIDMNRLLWKNPSSKKLPVAGASLLATSPSLLGTRALITTSNKKLLVTRCLGTGSKKLLVAECIGTSS